MRAERDGRPVDEQGQRAREGATGRGHSGFIEKVKALDLFNKSQMSVFLDQAQFAIRTQLTQLQITDHTSLAAPRSSVLAGTNS